MTFHWLFTSFRHTCVAPPSQRPTASSRPGARTSPPGVPPTPHPAGSGPVRRRASPPSSTCVTRLHQRLFGRRGADEIKTNSITCVLRTHTRTPAHYRTVVRMPLPSESFNLKLLPRTYTKKKVDTRFSTLTYLLRTVYLYAYFNQFFRIPLYSYLL